MYNEKYVRTLGDLCGGVVTLRDLCRQDRRTQGAYYYICDYNYMYI
jgi:hypothetical protein